LAEPLKWFRISRQFVGCQEQTWLIQNEPEFRNEEEVVRSCVDDSVLRGMTISRAQRFGRTTVLKPFAIIAGVLCLAGENLSQRALVSVRLFARGRVLATGPVKGRDGDDDVL
jgi:hypothetical protein